MRYVARSRLQKASAGEALSTGEGDLAGKGPKASTAASAPPPFASPLSKSYGPRVGRADPCEIVTRGLGGGSLMRIAGGLAAAPALPARTAGEGPVRPSGRPAYSRDGRSPEGLRSGTGSTAPGRGRGGHPAPPPGSAP